MRKLTLFLLLVSYVSIYAQTTTNSSPKTDGNQAYTTTEIDLKMQLQQKDIETLRNDVASYKEFVVNKIVNQDVNIAHSHEYVSNHVGMYGWWMTFMSIGAALAVFGIGVFVNWKIKKDLKEVNDDLATIRQLKQEIDL